MSILSQLLVAYDEMDLNGALSEQNWLSWVGRSPSFSTLQNTTLLFATEFPLIGPSQPISLTLEALARSELPSDWPSQEQMLGFREIP